MTYSIPTQTKSTYYDYAKMYSLGTPRVFGKTSESACAMHTVDYMHHWQNASRTIIMEVYGTPRCFRRVQRSRAVRLTTIAWRVKIHVFFSFFFVRARWLISQNNILLFLLLFVFALAISHVIIAHTTRRDAFLKIRTSRPIGVSLLTYIYIYSKYILRIVIYTLYAYYILSVYIKRTTRLYTSIRRGRSTVAVIIVVFVCVASVAGGCRIRVRTFRTGEGGGSPRGSITTCFASEPGSGFPGDVIKTRL